jgi:hypothetical protein
MEAVDEMVEEAIHTLGCAESEIRQLHGPEGELVVKKAMERFVDGNPRAWWMSLKRKYKKFPVDDNNLEYLEHHWPKSESHAYFVPENGTRALRAFDASLSAVKAVLGECSFFEYYVVGKRFDWLLAESDHSELFVVRNERSET